MEKDVKENILEVAFNQQIYMKVIIKKNQRIFTSNLVIADMQKVVRNQVFFIQMENMQKKIEQQQ